MGISTPLYAYFSYRNKLLFAERNAISFSAKDAGKILYYYSSCFGGYVRSRRYRVALGMILGIRDYFARRFGKGYYKRIL